LPRDIEASSPLFIRRRVFMDFFQESDPERIEYGERTADHTSRQIIQHGAIGVHHRESSCICV
jgi:hypothetical protein